MSFDLPEELRILRETVRRFVDEEMIPLEGKSLEGGKVKPEVKAALDEKAKALGLWLIDVPEEYGGQGLGLLARAVVWEELGRTVALPTRGVSMTGPDVRPILYALDDEMKEKYLYPVIRGEKECCFAQTEPDAGSDPGSMRTTAVRDGDDYVINGVKRFITGAADADFAQVMAATDREKGSRGGISCFIVDMDTPGISLTTQFHTFTEEGPWEIVFDNVRVSATHLVGEEGGGFRLAQQWLGVGRIKQASRALGVTERCLEMATKYAKERVTFGRPLAARQATQWKLVDAAVAVHGARLMVYHAASRLDEGEDARLEAYMAKLYCTEMAYQAADDCLQIHGGIGLTKDLPVERIWRDQRSHMITEGTPEMMRMVIARTALRAAN
ncbi:MAG TPA: acyl-CoA dehydrogenase family protein [Alphaproteobacteria bacterium]|nr:acyl-CoA dehydrogenase family protein [Alphaproteobacteria bacterium]